MGIPFLAVLQPLVVERLAREQEQISVAPDTMLIRQGDLGDYFFVIESGTVEVTQDNAALRRLGPGAWFGELALLRDVRRTASVRSVTDVEVAALSREAFLSAVTGATGSLEAADGHALSYFRADDRQSTKRSWSRSGTAAAVVHRQAAGLRRRGRPIGARQTAHYHPARGQHRKRCRQPPSRAGRL